MPTTYWRNPSRGNAGPLKRLAVEWHQSVGSPAMLLDRLAGALRGINHGRLWRLQPQLMARTDVGPDVYELSANAEYADGQATGHLVIEAVAQANSMRPAVGLVISYANQHGRMPLPWSDQESERIIAFTTLHISDSIRASIGAPRPPNEDPIGRWGWYEPCCGWLRGAQFFYGGWTVQLGG